MQTATESVVSTGYFYLKRMKLIDVVNGDELRFAVELCLDRDAVVELSAVWPDVPPLPREFIGDNYNVIDGKYESFKVIY